MGGATQVAPGRRPGENAQDGRPRRPDDAIGQLTRTRPITRLVPGLAPRSDDVMRLSRCFYDLEAVPRFAGVGGAGVADDSEGAGVGVGVGVGAAAESMASSRLAMSSEADLPPS